MDTKKLKLTAFLNLFGLTKVPLILFCAPRVVEVTDEKFVLKIPLTYRTKNHLKSMYFAALAVGAEISVAAPAVLAIHETHQKIDFVFKDFEAQFLKRPDGDVHFVCEDVKAVMALVEEAKTNPERVERKINGYAIVPSNDEKEHVMTYKLTLSLKNRKFRSET
jgi:hypothetical protein